MNNSGYAKFSFFLNVLFAGVIIIFLFTKGCKNHHPGPALERKVLTEANRGYDDIKVALEQSEQDHQKDSHRLRDSIKHVLSNYKFNPIQTNPVPIPVDSSDDQQCCEQIIYANQAIVFYDSLTSALQQSYDKCVQRGLVLEAQVKFNKKFSEEVVSDSEDKNTIIAERDLKITKLKKGRNRAWLITAGFVIYEGIRIVIRYYK